MAFNCYLFPNYVTFLWLIDNFNPWVKKMHVEKSYSNLEIRRSSNKKS
jgi:hypothetical protein